MAISRNKGRIEPLQAKLKVAEKLIIKVRTHFSGVEQEKYFIGPVMDRNQIIA